MKAGWNEELPDGRRETRPAGKGHECDDYGRTQPIGRPQANQGHVANDRNLPEQASREGGRCRGAEQPSLSVAHTTSQPCTLWRQSANRRCT